VRCGQVSGERSAAAQLECEQVWIGLGTSQSVCEARVSVCIWQWVGMGAGAGCEGVRCGQVSGERSAAAQLECEQVWIGLGKGYSVCWL
jgi:hypothetical protein